MFKLHNENQENPDLQTDADLPQTLSTALRLVSEALRGPAPDVKMLAGYLDIWTLDATRLELELALFRGEITPEAARPQIAALLLKQHELLPALNGGHMQ